MHLAAEMISGAILTFSGRQHHPLLYVFYSSSLYFSIAKTNSDIHLDGGRSAGHISIAKGISSQGFLGAVFYLLLKVFFSGSGRSKRCALQRSNRCSEKEEMKKHFEDEKENIKDVSRAKVKRLIILCQYCSLCNPKCSNLYASDIM